MNERQVTAMRDCITNQMLFEWGDGDWEETKLRVDRMTETELAAKVNELFEEGVDTFLLTRIIHLLVPPADPRNNREEEQPRLRLTPEQLVEARRWVKDCKWAEDFDDGDIDEMSDAEIEKGIAKHYEGGIIAFQNACTD